MMKIFRTGLAASFAVAASLVIMAALFVGQAEAQTAAEVNGQWRGDGSGNVIVQTLVPGGIEVRAVTNNPGQTQAQFFRQTAPYEWRSDTTGAAAVIRLQNGLITVSQPGWSDTFRRISQ